MKTIIQLFLILVISIASTKYSSAQYDVKIDGDNGGKTFVFPLTHTDNQVYTIGVRNGGIFTMKPANYIPGIPWWNTPNGDPTKDSIVHVGPGHYGAHYQKKTDNVWTYLDIYIRYYVDIINTTAGSASINQMVDTVWLVPGQTTATLSAGDKFGNCLWEKKGETGYLWEGQFTVNVPRGTYYLMAVDNGSYISKDTVTVEYAIASPATAPAGGEQKVTFTASQLGVTYTLFKNSAKVDATEKTGTGNNLIWTSLSAGTYQVKATTTKSGLAYEYMFPQVLTVTDIANGIGDISSDKMKILYKDNQLFLPDGKKSLQIYDLSGRILSSYIGNNSVIPMDLKPGIYVISLQTDNVKSCQKIFIK